MEPLKLDVHQRKCPAQYVDNHLRFPSSRDANKAWYTSCMRLFRDSLVIQLKAGNLSLKSSDFDARTRAWQASDARKSNPAVNQRYEQRVHSRKKRYALAHRRPRQARPSPRSHSILARNTHLGRLPLGLHDDVFHFRTREGASELEEAGRVTGK